MKTITKTIYETSDGKTFEDEKLAISHEEWLKLPRVYILFQEYMDTCTPSIKGVFEKEEKAKIELEKLNKDLKHHSHYSHKIVPKVLIK